MEDLFKYLYHLLDQEQFDEARKIIGQTLQDISSLELEKKIFIEAQLHGFLIDIGCESGSENDLNSAISFLEANEALLQTVMTKSSYYYNLANAKHALGKIFYSQNRGVHSLTTTKEKFQEPINLYWLAYKTIDTNDQSLMTQILINLSNSLITVSRIVEGLQFLDIVLRKQPNFPQALISRGDNLHYLSKVTNCSVTIALYTQIYKSYDNGILTNSLPPSILKRCEFGKEESLKTIHSHGFDTSNLTKEIEETEKEYNQHSSFRKFCLGNFLTLNEHAIYCNCVAAEKDDLQIGVPQGTFKGNLVPKLELLLNRMKSEFSFARWMFYKSNTEEPFDSDVKFSELLDGEIINSQTEFLRTSYRICYGILDKIALGICKLYDLDSKRIFFETFWDETKRKVELDKVKNIHLNALYSIACDLNTKTGELKHFKNWRNKLEHNLLILKDKKEFIPDTLKIFEDEEFVVVADVNDFNQKTLHLLQHTRAAILSYVYCVRLQTIQHKPEAESIKYFDIKFK